jgi:hypothetical protein
LLISDCQLPIGQRRRRFSESAIGNRQSAIGSSPWFVFRNTSPSPA